MPYYLLLCMLGYIIVNRVEHSDIDQGQSSLCYIIDVFLPVVSSSKLKVNRKFITAAKCWYILDRFFKKFEGTLVEKFLKLEAVFMHDFRMTTLKFLKEIYSIRFGVICTRFKPHFQYHLIQTGSINFNFLEIFILCKK